MDNSSQNGSPAGRNRVTGHFQKGNNFSRGNAVARRTRELRQATLDAVSADQVAAVITKLAALAADGDVPAARVFLEHVIGKPTQALEVTGADGQVLGLDMDRLLATIQATLAKHPEIKFELAAQLQKLSHADDDNEPDQVPGDRA